MKKRVFAVLLAVMLIVASFSTASAATAGLSADKTELAVGEKVTVSVTIPALEKKAATIQFNVDFNNKVVKLVEWNPIAEEMGLKGVGTEEWAGYEYDAETDGYVANFDLANNNGQYSATYIGKANSAAINLTEGVTWTATFEAIAEGDAGFNLKTFIVYGVDEATGAQASILEGEVATGAKVTVKAAPCKEHTWGEWTTVEATCTEDGMKVRTCSVCGAEDTETIKATGHKLGEWTVITEATCEEDGVKEAKCENCDHVATEVIKATGHTWGEWVLNEDGKTETRTCSVCNETETREYNPETGDSMSAVLFLAMAAMFVAGIVTVKKARKNA